METALVAFGLNSRSNRQKRPILSGSRYFQMVSERQTVTKEDGSRLTVRRSFLKTANRVA